MLLNMRYRQPLLCGLFPTGCPLIGSLKNTLSPVMLPTVTVSAMPESKTKTLVWPKNGQSAENSSSKTNPSLSSKGHSCL